jgi:hypothetical protein
MRVPAFKLRQPFGRIERFRFIAIDNTEKRDLEIDLQRKILEYPT